MPTTTTTDEPWREEQHSSTSASSPPEIVLLLDNPSRGNNLGSILRCACASGVRQMLTVGYDKCAVQGAHGADRHVSRVAFATAPQAIQALTTSNDNVDDDDDSHQENVVVIGLLGAFPNGYNIQGYPVKEDEESGLVMPLLDEDDIQETTPLLVARNISYPIHALPLVLERYCAPPSRPPIPPLDDSGRNGKNNINNRRFVCLVISKDRLGLPRHLADVCHFFCHVPCVPLWEPSSTTTTTDALPVSSSSLLDTPSTLTITLHHLAACLGYNESTFEGHKFHVIKKKPTATERHETQTIRQRQTKTNHADESDDDDDAAMMLSLWDNEIKSEINNGDY